MQTLGHWHLFILSADEIPSAIYSLLACKVYWIDVCDQAQQLLVNSYFNKSDTFEGYDIDTIRDNTFLNNINRSTLLKLLPPNENAFKQHIKHAAKPFSSLRTWVVENGKMIPVQSTWLYKPTVATTYDSQNVRPARRVATRTASVRKGKSLLCMTWLSGIPKQMQLCTT